MEHLSSISILCTEEEFKNPPPESDEFLPLDEYHVVYVQMADGSLKMRRRINGGRVIVKPVKCLPTRKNAANNVVQMVKNPREDLLKDNVNLLPAGKVPGHLLWQIIAFFKSVMENKLSSISPVGPGVAQSSYRHEYEAMAHIVYNIHTKEYRVGIPTQRVSKAAVSYDRDSYDEKAGDVMVVDIHSHKQHCAFAG